MNVLKAISKMKLFGKRAASANAASAASAASAAEDEGGSQHSSQEDEYFQRSIFGYLQASINGHDVFPRPVGVISFHLRHATRLVLPPSSATESYFLVAQVTIDGRSKTTDAVGAVDYAVSWDSRMRFGLTVPAQHDHVSNLIKITLLMLVVVRSSGDNESLGHGFAGSKTRMSELGCVFFHLHDIMHSRHVEDNYEVWGEHHLVGKMRLALDFCYGEYGRGHSVRLLRNSQAGAEAGDGEGEPHSQGQDQAAAAMDVPASAPCRSSYAMPRGQPRRGSGKGGDGDDSEELQACFARLGALLDHEDSAAGTEAPKHREPSALLDEFAASDPGFERQRIVNDALAHVRGEKDPSVDSFEVS